MKSYLMFDEIIKHLERKKAKPTWNSNKQAVKVKYYLDDQLKDHGYIMLIADYNYYHISITYTPEKHNPYNVVIETTAYFKKYQDSGTRFWREDWHRQIDVIEYIRYKLR